MHFVRTVLTFMAGVYVGQEYPNSLPIRENINKKLEEFKKTEVYKNFIEEFNKSK